ncbi:MAG: Bax inhibitor-1/YccA family protein [Polyangiaceae bacterium]|nr:Bax inhibitor-1/YccA family protein [Polyangiaceae bacterium]
MQDAQFPEFFGQVQPRDEGAEQLAFLKKVYSLLTLTILFAMAGACCALYVGTSTSEYVYQSPSGAIVLMPPMVAFVSRYIFLALIVFLGSVWGANHVRAIPGVNVAALFGMGFISGLFVAPAIFIAQRAASAGESLTPDPVRDAFILAVCAFSGLTLYVMVSKKDFSYLRGTLWSGFWVVLGASILGFFVESSAFSLAIAGAGVMLFCGFILYDTSRLLRNEDTRRDAVGAAISLFLDFLNLFLFLLRIFRRN